MCWGILAGSDCVHTIWEWSLANGLVVLAFVINVSVEKFKMRSMCFSFASVLKRARCAWDTKTFSKECLRRLCMRLLLRALILFLSWLVITVSLILRSMHSWIKTHTDSSSLCQIRFQFSTLVDFVSPANCHQPESRAVGHPCNPCNPLLMKVGRRSENKDIQAKYIPCGLCLQAAFPLCNHGKLF